MFVTFNKFWEICDDPQKLEWFKQHWPHGGDVRVVFDSMPPRMRYGLFFWTGHRIPAVLAEHALLFDPEQEVRKMAAGYIDSRQPALGHAIRNDPHWEVRLHAVRCSKLPDALAFAVRFDSDWEVRLHAAKNTSTPGWALEQGLEDVEVCVQQAAKETLDRIRYYA